MARPQNQDLPDMDLPKDRVLDDQKGDESGNGGEE